MSKADGSYEVHVPGEGEYDIAVYDARQPRGSRRGRIRVTGNMTHDITLE
ncbi:MAG TPA: hypothetical protein VGF69_16515 [Thermoanaerobaculia bacterium]